MVNVNLDTISVLEQRLGFLESIRDVATNCNWSPEQIHGWMKINMVLTVSPEWIYQYILRDKQTGGFLYQHLRCKKKRKKRYGANDRRGNLKNRVSIEDRPNVVEDRSRIGDWEADTVIGKAHKQAIVSLTERKSGLALFYKVDHRTKENTASAITKLLNSISDRVYTITSDNNQYVLFVLLLSLDL